MQDFRMYLETYVNIQVMRICTDTCTGTTIFIYRIMPWPRPRTKI